MCLLCCCDKIIRAPVVCPEQKGKVSTQIMITRKGKILLLSGTFKQVKLSSLKVNFFRLIFSLELFQQQKGFALEMITGRNAGRRPNIWSKITIFIALGDFQTG